MAAGCADLKKNGQFDRCVKALNRCLTDYLNFPKDSLFSPRVREGFEKVIFFLLFRKEMFIS